MSILFFLTLAWPNITYFTSLCVFFSDACVPFRPPSLLPYAMLHLLDFFHIISYAVAAVVVSFSTASTQLLVCMASVCLSCLLHNNIHKKRLESSGGGSSGFSQCSSRSRMCVVPYILLRYFSTDRRT